MHVAFFNRSYYPDQSATGQLLTDLCEDLVSAHGCRVSVVTGVPLLPSEAGGAVRGGILQRERRNGVDIFRARGTRYSKRRFVGRATNYGTYFLSACYAGLRLDKPDVVVAFMPSMFPYMTLATAGTRTRAIAAIHNVPARELGSVDACVDVDGATRALVSARLGAPVGAGAVESLA